jgi:hypothetical protein
MMRLAQIKQLGKPYIIKDIVASFGYLQTCVKKNPLCIKSGQPSHVSDHLTLCIQTVA